MNILILNIRDIKNPAAGGAEVFTHAIARNWVRAGNKVTIVAAKFRGAQEKETIDGINIIRIGNNFTVYLRIRRFIKKNQDQFDIIIDEYTCRPFLTPKYVQKPIVFLVYELARDKYFYVLPPLVSHCFYFCIEPGWLKEYLNVPTITISNSTKSDLSEFGFNKIDIVPIGINLHTVSQVKQKEEHPTFLFVGLLKKLNLVDHVIEAFRLISKELPTAKLWIVGRGEERGRLEKMAENMNITFFGYVSEEMKTELMSRAHAILVPAVREGWGLIVTEANACGTPAIGYNVHGLRDSIRDKETGMLTKCNPKSLSDAAIELYNNKELRFLMTENSLNWSKEFSWENTSNLFMDVLIRECDKLK